MGFRVSTVSTTAVVELFTARRRAGRVGVDEVGAGADKSVDGR